MLHKYNLTVNAVHDLENICWRLLVLVLEMSEEVKDQYITEIFLCKITKHRAIKKKKKKNTVLESHQKIYFD